MKHDADNEALETAELQFLLDKLSALTAKDTLMWQCAEYFPPDMIPTEHHQEECMVQSMQAIAEYRGVAYTMEMTDIIHMSTGAAEAVISLSRNGRMVTLCPDMVKTTEDKAVWSHMVDLSVLVFDKLQNPDLLVSGWKQRQFSACELHLFAIDDNRKDW